MRWIKLLATAGVATVVVACGGSDGPYGEEAQTRSPTAPERPESPGDEDRGGAPDDPLPAGTAFVLSEVSQNSADPVPLWEVMLAPTDQDATAQVLAENDLNEIVEGRTAVMVPVTLTYVGPDSGDPWVDLFFEFVGSDGNTYSDAPEDWCGVIPDDLADRGEMFPDATVTGNVCLAVPDDVIDGGAWIVESIGSWEGERVFVSVD